MKLYEWLHNIGIISVQLELDSWFFRSS